MTMISTLATAGPPARNTVPPSTGPLGTGSLSAGSPSAGPLGTGPLSASPLSTESRSTGSMNSESMSAGAPGGGRARSQQERAGGDQIRVHAHRLGRALRMVHPRQAERSDAGARHRRQHVLASLQGEDPAPELVA